MASDKPIGPHARAQAPGDDHLREGAGHALSREPYATTPDPPESKATAGPAGAGNIVTAAKYPEGLKGALPLRPGGSVPTIVAPTGRTPDGGRIWTFSAEQSTSTPTIGNSARVTVDGRNWPFPFRYETDRTTINLENGEQLVIHHNPPRPASDVMADRRRLLADENGELKPRKRGAHPGNAPVRSSRPLPSDKLVGFFKEPTRSAETDAAVKEKFASHPIRVQKGRSIATIISGRPFSDIGEFGVALYKKAFQELAKEGKLRGDFQDNAKFDKFEKLFAGKVSAILPEFRKNWSRDLTEADKQFIKMTEGQAERSTRTSERGSSTRAKGERRTGNQGGVRTTNETVRHGQPVAAQRAGVRVRSGAGTLAIEGRQAQSAEVIDPNATVRGANARFQEIGNPPPSAQIQNRVKLIEELKANPNNNKVLQRLISGFDNLVDKRAGEVAKEQGVATASDALKELFSEAAVDQVLDWWQQLIEKPEMRQVAASELSIQLGQRVSRALTDVSDRTLRPASTPVVTRSDLSEWDLYNQRPSSSDRPQESRLITQETEAIVKDAIETLPPGYRTATQRSLLEGKRYDKIAEEMGISQSRVGQLVDRSLRVLKGRIVDFEKKSPKERKEFIKRINAKMAERTTGVFDAYGETQREMAWNRFKGPLAEIQGLPKEHLRNALRATDDAGADKGLRLLSEGATNVLATLHKLDEGGVRALVEDPERWLRESEVGKKLRKEIAGITDLNERRTLRERLENWLKRAQPKRGGTGVGPAYAVGLAEDWAKALAELLIP